MVDFVANRFLKKLFQSEAVCGVSVTATPLTKAVGVPLTPIAVEYFQRYLTLMLVLCLSCCLSYRAKMSSALI